MENIYEWTDNPTVSGLSVCDTDVLNDCLMHLKYEHGGGNPYSLLQPVWSDKKLNNVSWLISQGQANSGIVYQSVYELLQSEYESGYEETENICGVTITYHLSEKGYKITTDKDSYDRLYVLTGTSWFYVLDEENTEFYLPRTNGFMQFGSVGGQFIEAGLPEHTHLVSVNINGSNTDGGDPANQYVTHPGQYNGTRQLTGIASSISGFNVTSTVQPNAVTGYLYFYVGDTVKNQGLIDVATIAEGLANKADISMLNARTERYVIEKSDPSLLPSWYTVYSDGWIEQGGRSTTNWAGSATTTETVELLKSYNSTDFTCLVTKLSSTPNNSYTVSCNIVSPSQITLNNNGSIAGKISWLTCGYGE